MIPFCTSPLYVSPERRAIRQAVFILGVLESGGEYNAVHIADQEFPELVAGNARFGDLVHALRVVGRFDRVDPCDDFARVWRSSPVNTTTATGRPLRATRRPINERQTQNTRGAGFPAGRRCR
ncbi:hypothetical protein GCM10027184_23100 [Saccharothrix stipae]